MRWSRRVVDVTCNSVFDVLALSAAILKLFLVLSSSYSFTLPLPFFPIITTVPRPLPLPNCWFLHSQTHRSFRKPTRQNWQTDKCRDCPRLQKWLLRLTNPKQTARRSVGGRWKGPYIHSGRPFLTCICADFHQGCQKLQWDFRQR